MLVLSELQEATTPLRGSVILRHPLALYTSFAAL